MPLQRLRKRGRGVDGWVCPGEVQMQEGGVEVKDPKKPDIPEAVATDPESPWLTPKEDIVFIKELSRTIKDADHER